MIRYVKPRLRTDSAPENMRPGSEPAEIPQKCEKLHRALYECHRRVPAGPGRESACRHLNRGMAECVVSVACPEEWEAVRAMCGTALKRSQCEEARLSLAVCLSSYQQQ